MENNILMDNKKKEKYKILFELDLNDNDDKYVVYTRNQKNKDGDFIAYAAKYNIKDGNQFLEPILDEDIYEYMNDILLQIQSKMNKEVGE